MGSVDSLHRVVTVEPCLMYAGFDVTRFDGGFGAWEEKTGAAGSVTMCATGGCPI